MAHVPWSSYIAQWEGLNVHLKAWDILGMKFLLVLELESSVTLSPAHTEFFFSPKKHPVLSRTIFEHWKYGLFGIPCNTSDTKRNIILNNIIFVLVNAWYLCVRWMHVINHLYVCSADWACHMSLCSLHHSGIQFSFLYWTVIIIPLLPSLQRRWRGDCVKEYRVVQSVSPQDTVFRTQLSKIATLYHKAVYINFS